MFVCGSLFENPSVLMNSKAHNTYQLLGLEPMHVFDLEVTSEFRDVFITDWGVND